jgi:hypothetical protein
MMMKWRPNVRNTTSPSGACVNEIHCGVVKDRQADRQRFDAKRLAEREQKRFGGTGITSTSGFVNAKQEEAGADVVPEELQLTMALDDEPAFQEIEEGDDDLI